MPKKLVLKDYQEVREMREGSNMHYDDWDVEVAISSNPVNVTTGLTPRLVDGRKDPEVPKSRILPMSVNPREGWRTDLKGGVDDRVVHELTTIPNMERTAVRDKESGLFLPELGLSDSPRGKRAMILGEQQRKMVNPLTYTKGTEAEQEELLQTFRIQHMKMVGEEEKEKQVRLREEEGVRSISMSNEKNDPKDPWATEGALAPSDPPNFDPEEEQRLRPRRRSVRRGGGVQASVGAAWDEADPGLSLQRLLIHPRQAAAAELQLGVELAFHRFDQRSGRTVKPDRHG